VFLRFRRDAPSRSYPCSFKALTISTHLNSQLLTKHVPFATVFPLLKRKQVMRHPFFAFVGFKENSGAYHPSFPIHTVASFHRLGFAHYYGTIRYLAVRRIGFPLLGLYLPYLAALHQGNYKTSLCHQHILFHHPDPNHVNEPYRSYSFPVSL
jgi:hypothetical protein